MGARGPRLPVWGAGRAARATGAITGSRTGAGASRLGQLAAPFAGGAVIEGAAGVVRDGGEGAQVVSASRTARAQRPAERQQLVDPFLRRPLGGELPLHLRKRLTGR